MKTDTYPVRAKSWLLPFFSTICWAITGISPPSRHQGISPCSCPSPSRYISPLPSTSVNTLSQSEPSPCPRLPPPTEYIVMGGYHLLSPVANKVYTISISAHSHFDRSGQSRSVLTPQVRTLPSKGFRARKDWYDLKIDAIFI